MVLVKLAAYILAIAVVLTLASKVMWLLFILFAFRSWSAILSVEFVTTHIPFINEVGYFFLMLGIAIATYYLVVQLTKDYQWVRYIILLLMSIWVFRNYSIADVFLFKDWFINQGFWGVGYWQEQFRELFNTDAEGIQGVFLTIFEKVFNWFVQVWEFIRRI